MSPPFLDTAIVKAMQRDPGASRVEVRDQLGISNAQMDEAIKRLRYAGKMVWGKRFALSPSMQQNTQGASGTARKAPGAASSGAAQRGSASAPSDSQPLVGNAYGTGGAKGAPRISRRADKPRSEPPADRTLPGAPTIADQVKAEAMAKADRRALATKISTGLEPLPAESLADRFHRLAREADEEEQQALAEAEADERRERDLERLASPSAVLRRAQRDWPQQCQDVASIAKELGIGLGECWRRVIKAGVDCLREAGDEARA